MKLGWGFLSGVVASLAIHAGLVFSVPPPDSDAVVREPIHVVELRRLEIPLPALPPLPKKDVEETQDFGPPPVLPQPKAPEPLPTGLSPRDMSIATGLPDVKAPLPSPSEMEVPARRETAFVAPPETIGEGDAPQGMPSGTVLLGPISLPSALPPVGEEQAGSIRSLRSRLIRRVLERSAPAERSGAKILGPAADRKLVSRPPPPRWPQSAQGEIELKFWVLADGTVGRVVLLVRGPLALETAAIQHIKRWKFNPVPVDAAASEHEQWGTIRFRFLSAAAKPVPTLLRSLPPKLREDELPEAQTP